LLALFLGYFMCLFYVSASCVLMRLLMCGRELCIIVEGTFKNLHQLAGIVMRMVIPGQSLV